MLLLRADGWSRNQRAMTLSDGCEAALTPPSSPQPCPDALLGQDAMAPVGTRRAASAGHAVLSQPARVAVVNLQRAYGGAERHCLMLASGLASAGCLPTLICHPKGGLMVEARALGLRVRHMMALTQMDPTAPARMTRILQRLSPDVVHLHTPKDYVCGALAAGRARAPAVVATRHMLLPVKPHMRGVFNSLDAVVCLTEAVRLALQRDGVDEHKLALIRPAAEALNTSQLSSLPAASRFGIPQGALVAGVVGRLVEGKGHSILLEAFEPVAARFPQAHLLIAGDGPLRRLLEERASRSAAASRIHFAGFVQQVASVYAALDVLVLPSTSTEVAPLALIEAMSMGVPVVASRAGSVEEIVEPGRAGLLVPPRDAPALAEALATLLGRPELRVSLAAAARDAARQEFSLARMVQETLDLYTRILARQARRGISSSVSDPS